MPPSFFQNNHDGTFTQIATNAIAQAPKRSLGSTVGDFDNNGYLDLFCAGAEGKRNRLFHNRGDGTFEEILTGGIPTYSGYSYQAAWGDYDNDGYLDLFVANDSIEGNFLYRNNHREHLAQLGLTNHWLNFNLRGTQSNRSGIGAKVRVTATIGGRRITDPDAPGRSHRFNCMR